MLSIAALAATLLTLPAPQTVMRWPVPSGLPAAKPGSLPPVCQQVGSHRIEAGRKTTHKLSKEPPAKELKAVLYTEGGCVKPVVVRERIGN